MTASGGSRPSTSPGAGCPAFGDVPVLPVSGRLPADPAAATVGLDHADEAAGPGWYRGPARRRGVGVSLAAGDRTGLATFRFPAGPQGRLLLKADGSLAGTRRGRLSFPSRNEVAVSVDERRVLRLAGQLSRPCAAALRPTRGGARHLGGGSAP